MAALRPEQREFYAEHGYLVVEDAVDEVIEQNGPLQVLPGSHRDPIHSLWRDGPFTGAVTEEVEAR